MAINSWETERLSERQYSIAFYYLQKKREETDALISLV
jgi:hypothetical protein